jgi:beta-lactamase regulating signal transducer with metallopeptidase domain
MLENIFIAVLNMSITASIAAVLITFIRWIFGRRLPKIFGYTLWVIVLLRLFIPFFIPSMFSVFNLIPMPQTSMAQSQHYYETKGTIPYSMNDGNTSVEITAADALSNKINSSLPLPVPEASVDLLQVLTFTVSWIWLVGTAGLLLFSLFAYFHTQICSEYCLTRILSVRWDSILGKSHNNFRTFLQFVFEVSRFC